MIKIICLGKIKEKFFTEAIKEYEKRITKYTKITILELEDAKDTDVNYALKHETELIKKHLTPKDNIVILDIKGTQQDSIQFSKFITNELAHKSNITFIIGSSNGLSEEIKNLANTKISFSNLTFPHQLFRIILLEQIYRAFKIENNETYHK